MAHAQQARVVVGGMLGVRNSRQAIIGLQRALKKQGFSIQSTKSFLAEARSRGLARRLPSDAQALVDLCGVMNVDAVIYVKRTRPARDTWPRARRSDRVLDTIVYSGHDGSVLTLKAIRAPRGRLTREVWNNTARALSGGIGQALAPPPPPPPPPLRIESEPQRRPQPTQTPEDIGSVADPMLVMHAGLSFRSRSFQWKAAGSSAVFKNGGIEYDSALVPGIGIEGEFYPFRNSSTVARGIGFGVQFDKVFLETEQKEIVSAGEAGNLETSHQQLRLRILYERAIGVAADALRLQAVIGMGWLSFDVAGGDDYRGTSYQFFEVGGGAVIPLGSPLFNLEARFTYVPTADLGDTVEEVGDSATATGFNLQTGMLLSMPEGLTARIGLDYQVFSIVPTGAGRDGRVGAEADDAYLGFRIQAGYRF